MWPEYSQLVARPTLSAASVACLGQHVILNVSFFILTAMEQSIWFGAYPERSLHALGIQLSEQYKNNFTDIEDVLSVDSADQALYYKEHFPFNTSRGQTGMASFQ
jgi:hypothetical protein